MLFIRVMANLHGYIASTDLNWAGKIIVWIFEINARMSPCLNYMCSIFAQNTRRTCEIIHKFT